MGVITSHRVILPKPGIFFHSRNTEEAKSKPSQLSQLERAQGTWVPALPLLCWVFLCQKIFLLLAVNNQVIHTFAF